LHLGSLRTALFNYLIARRTGGQFLLRIEDTDQKRTVSDAEARLVEDLRWAGLEWDEGPDIGGPFGSYKQSERTQLYQDHARQLIETGHAYRCFCTQERLNKLAESRHQMGLPTDYDRHCFHVSREESESRANAGEAFVVRLKAPAKYPPFHDLVYGKVGKESKTRPQVHPAFDDPILLKSDGLPTYHLANVVDDGHVLHAVRLLTRDEDSLMGTYADYIDRLTEDKSAAGKIALIVKVADLTDNLRRCRAEGNDSLARRYEKALDLVSGELLRRA